MYKGLFLPEQPYLFKYSIMQHNYYVKNTSLMSLQIMTDSLNSTIQLWFDMR